MRITEVQPVENPNQLSEYYNDLFNKHFNKSKIIHIDSELYRFQGIITENRVDLPLEILYHSNYLFTQLVKWDNNVQMLWTIFLNKNERNHTNNHLFEKLAPYLKEILWD